MMAPRCPAVYRAMQSCAPLCKSTYMPSCMYAHCLLKYIFFSPVSVAATDPPPSSVRKGVKRTATIDATIKEAQRITTAGGDRNAVRQPASPSAERGRVTRQQGTSTGQAEEDSRATRQRLKSPAAERSTKAAAAERSKSPAAERSSKAAAAERSKSPAAERSSKAAAAEQSKSPAAERSTKAAATKPSKPPTEETKGGDDEDKADSLICELCGRSFKAACGLASHRKFCKGPAIEHGTTASAAAAAEGAKSRIERSRTEIF